MSAHGVSVTVTARRQDGMATQWQARCACREKWSGKTYEAVEDGWRQHIHALTGRAPRPCGEKGGRWMP